MSNEKHYLMQFENAFALEIIQSSYAEFNAYHHV